MSLFWFIGLISIDIIFSKYSCENFEHEYCDAILRDRYGLTHNDWENMNEIKQLIMLDSLDCVRENKCPLDIPKLVGTEYECIDGKAGIVGEILYPCNNVNLLSFIPLIDLGSSSNSSGNDIWGWTDFDNNGNAVGHYAITGQTDGSSIVDITDPINPVVLAFIATNVEPIRQINWRDVKTHKDWAYVVADGSEHGLQSFNMRNLIAKAKEHQIENPGQIYDAKSLGIIGEDIVTYMEISNCHNIFINEDTGYLYAVGSSGMRGNDCGNGLHVVDINDPYNPKFAGCHGNSTDDYVHDAQCVLYHGPDTKYQNHEICFDFTPRSDVLTIVDATDKDNIIKISETEYPYPSYNHQGWCTTNHEYLLMDDELDELDYPDERPTQVTFIWDIANLENPILVETYDSNLTVIDHNQYIIDNGYSTTTGLFKGYAFQSNYESGVRILNIDEIHLGNIYEMAYFDNYIWISENGRDYNWSNPDDPDWVHNQKNFRGSWSVYPFYKHNINENEYTGIFVSMSINTGLYVLRETFGLNEIYNVESTPDNSELNTTFPISLEIGICIALGIVIIFVGILYICLVKPKWCKSDDDDEVQQLLRKTTPIEGVI